MRLERGDFVSLTFCGATVIAMVVLVSPDQQALMLSFAGVLGKSGGPGFVGAMPVQMDRHGTYRDLLLGEEVVLAQPEGEAS